MEYVWVNRLDDDLGHSMMQAKWDARGCLADVVQEPGGDGV
jgi:hypothetical protein